MSSTRSLRIYVSPLRFEDEDLRGYARYLSFRNRDGLSQLRIYNFPCDEHGVVTGVRLQIVLEGETLTLTRARHENSHFGRLFF